MAPLGRELYQTDRAVCKRLGGGQKLIYTSAVPHTGAERCRNGQERSTSGLGSCSGGADLYGGSFCGLSMHPTRCMTGGSHANTTARCLQRRQDTMLHCHNAKYTSAVYTDTCSLHWCSLKSLLCIAGSYKEKRKRIINRPFKEWQPRLSVSSELK